jgi:hypothetical protein
MRPRYWERLTPPLLEGGEHAIEAKEAPILVEFVRFVRRLG